LYIFFETLISPPRGGVQGTIWCSNRISGANISIVYSSNYGSVLVSFRDMTTGRTTDRRWQPMHIWPLRWACKNDQLISVTHEEERVLDSNFDGDYCSPGSFPSLLYFPFSLFFPSHPVLCRQAAPALTLGFGSFQKI